jgi:hypothetical protein
VLQRLRQSVRRWPGLCVALLLTAFASQGFAATLSWCLHGSDDSHVTSTLQPCDTVVADAESGHAHCHGAPQHHTAHFSAASSLASAPVAAMPVAPTAVLRHPVLVAVWSSVSQPPSTSRWRPGAMPGEARPRLAGAVAGQSTRLLI